jgi:hypothetical protein
MNKNLLIFTALFFVLIAVFQERFLGANQNSSFQNVLEHKVEKIDATANYITLKNYGARIYITNPHEVDKRRNRLIKYIWKSEGLPKDKMPDQVEKSIKDDRYSDLNNLEKIDKLIITMDYGVNSIAYHFHPVQKNNRLIIYHQGHDGDFIAGKNTIQFFLNKGYSVIAFSMPLLGMNNQPTLDIPPFGQIKLAPRPTIGHGILQFLETDNFSPIKFFLEPIAVSINYVEKSFSFESINMIGISGGGWTTTLYAAVDPRISKSYPVAGTLPIYLRSIQNDFGDYEQNFPELYRVVNYLDLYILGSYGDGRKQLQILNKYDSCCFAGEGYKTYDSSLKKVVSRLGKGEFDVYLDDSHKEHKISDNALNVIINDLEQ